MVKYCKLRNVQLDHSRTFVNIFIRMMNSDIDCSAIAARLLAALPLRLDKQTQSYTKMIHYLKYIVIVSIYLNAPASSRPPNKRRRSMYFQ
jgi:hypothetical protein